MRRSVSLVLLVVFVVFGVALLQFRQTVASATSFTTPEGAVIQIDSVGPWTTDQIYRMLRENGLNSTIGPTLTVKVQDVYASTTTASAVTVGGVYSNFRATIYLKGISSTFATMPDAGVGHEFGHAWTLYHLYISRQNDWSTYLQFRGLTGDPRLDSTYNWSKMEMIAEDYRLILGSQAAKDEKPWYINPDVPLPSTFPGFSNFFLQTWAAAAAPAPSPMPTASPAPTLAPTPTSTPTPTLTPAPTAAPTPSPTPSPAMTPAPAPLTLTALTATPQSFRRSTKIGFTLSATASVSVVVTDAAGSLVRTLAGAVYGSGSYDLAWDGSDTAGSRVPSGSYIVRLQATDSVGQSASAQVAVTAK